MRFKLIFFLVFVFYSCEPSLREQTAASIRTELLNANSDKVLVVAHRGDWRNAPENSLQAIQNCIEMGVDVVEVDVRMTKDSVLILMHDKTVDRTTTGKGSVSDLTYQQIQSLYLRNGANHPTHHKVPRLDQAMSLAKGKIMVNLDKCYTYFDLAFKVLEETETTDHVIMKGKVPVHQVEQEFGTYLDKVFFMPVLDITKSDASNIIQDYEAMLNPIAYELIFDHLQTPVVSNLSSIRQSESRIWVNSLWESLNAGYEDDMALLNPDSIYGWYIKNNINIIQTDRPELLLSYLRANGLHD
ncbi:MAG: glycerophosphodiester phosphodiesterase family protein [Bacteroidota bacterium]